MINRQLLLIFLCLIFSVVCVSCNENESGDSPPKPPTFVSKSSDTSQSMRGIQPSILRYSNRNGLYIEWLRNPERNLAGYEIWRTEQTTPSTNSPINFSLRQRIELGSQSSQNLPDTVFIDDNIQIGRRYFYKLRAFSRLNSMSDFSDSTQQYQLGDLISSVNPIGNINLPSDSLLTFQWITPSPFEAGSYCLKVYEFTDSDFRPDDCVAIAVGQNFNTDSIRIDFKRLVPTIVGERGTRVFKKLERGKTYIWFVLLHREGIDAFTGAPSTSRFFTINSLN